MKVYRAYPVVARQFSACLERAFGPVHVALDLEATGVA